MDHDVSDEPRFHVSLIAGGVAGMTVDFALFPLDTLKTRLQSPVGFWKSGGFQHLYKGIYPVLIGSAPSSAMFFATYNTVKKYSKNAVDEAYAPLIHMVAASVGEVACCSIKVPVEVLKQRQQASVQKVNAWTLIQRAVALEGILGLYRGYSTTVLREVPFVLVQFPLWEWMKRVWSTTTRKSPNVMEVSICGAISGGIAAAVTTPLDVAKTRIMLAEKQSNSRAPTFNMLRVITKESGWRGLFVGVVPRVLWITLGGAIFFGTYEVAKNTLES